MLEKWRIKVGHIEADRISNAALERGKMYDTFIEDYVNGIDIPHKKLQEYLKQFEIVLREEKS
jgi:mannitol/fructose-specific phosphotransferase system IIA component (Ntr-type)